MHCSGECLEKAEVEVWKAFEFKAAGEEGNLKRTNRNNYHKIVSKNGCFQKKLLPKIVAPLRFEEVPTNSQLTTNKKKGAWKRGYTPQHVKLPTVSIVNMHL